MEATILSVLKSKGALKEKKLQKKVEKKLEEEGKALEEKKFAKALSRLLESKEVLKQANEELALNKVQVTLKRRREDDDDEDEETTTAAVEKEKKKKSKKDKKDTDNDNHNNNNNEEEEEKTTKKDSAEEDDGEFKIKKRWNYADLWKNGERYWKEDSLDPEYLRTNPDRITRLFCGNLARKITEEDLMARIEGITYIKWITDKQTGEFYGSSFIEMKDAASAAAAVMQDKSKFMGRPLKIYYCPPRPGDVWPPGEGRGGPKRTNANGNSSSGNNANGREKTEKPEGCRKLFAGNLSYDIDDDTIVDFFKDCGTLVGLRWLTRQETGEFRGCGYVEFSSTEEADRAMEMDGKELLGRKIRLDWTN